VRLALVAAAAVVASLAPAAQLGETLATRPSAPATQARAAGPLAGMPSLTDGLPRLVNVDVDPALGGAVTRWDPCTPVHWRINLAGAPRGALADAQGAIKRIAKASGLSFTFDGRTGVVPAGDYGAANDADQSWPALTIAFVAPGASADLTAPAVGVGGWHAVTVSADQGHTWVPRIVAGFVLLDRAAAASLRSGFGAGGTLGQLLLHELGHTVGLGHVADPTQVMYPRINTKRAVFGKGDLQALHEVGRPSGCLPGLPPPNGY
jgi:hypothetical protein